MSRFGRTVQRNTLRRKYGSKGIKLAMQNIRRKALLIKYQYLKSNKLLTKELESKLLAEIKANPMTDMSRVHRGVVIKGK